MGQFWETLQLVGLAAWLAGAVYFILQLGVFSPRSLKEAPARESGLSLPLIGLVILLYLMMQTVCAAVVLQMGVPATMFAPATARAEVPGSKTQAATASAPATGTMAASTAPGTMPALPPGDWRTDRELVLNLIALGTSVLTLIPILLVVPRLSKGGWSGWGLSWRQLPGGAALGLGGIAIVYPVLIAFSMGLLWVYGLFRHELSEHPTFEGLNQGGSVLRQSLLCFVAVAVAPVLEETFFRGIVQTTLVQFRWGAYLPQLMGEGLRPLGFRPSAGQRWGAIVLTAVFFASIHQSDQAPIIFVLALGLGYVYERTGNLWAAIALHLAFNGTQIGTYFAGG